MPDVTLMTIAANLGSMLTPIGNPQNLYLYGRSGMSAGGFVALMFPYAALSALLLAAALFLFYRGERADCSVEPPRSPGREKAAVLRGAVWPLPAHGLRNPAGGGAAGADCGRCGVGPQGTAGPGWTYGLLLTFVAFFVFIGNMGRLPQFKGFLESILTGNERVVSVVASQVISNVPAALLLSGFTDQWRELTQRSTNLGGLGTLIASMASLISYKQIAVRYPGQKGRYLAMFTVWNVVFLGILLAASAVL